jgi:hypothetical protein
MSLPILLQNSVRGHLRAILESKLPNVRIILAHRRLILNQYCSLRPPKIVLQQYLPSSDSTLGLAAFCMRRAVISAV